jgi:hypothetical protein
MLDMQKYENKRIKIMILMIPKGKPIEGLCNEIGVYLQIGLGL